MTLEAFGVMFKRTVYDHINLMTNALSEISWSLDDEYTVVVMQMVSGNSVAFKY